MRHWPRRRPQISDVGFRRGRVAHDGAASALTGLPKAANLPRERAEQAHVGRLGPSSRRLA
jgi:hypothetical protein